MLKIINLTKYYRAVLGVKNITLTVKRGEIFGFIGPNGAGKTTVLKCILNLINITDGEIYINDQKMTGASYYLKEKIGYLPSEINLYGDLTVKAMLEYSASFYKKDCRFRMSELVKCLKLDLGKKVGALSIGNLKKLGIVLALMHEPELLILDEPTSGLDPLMQALFFKLLKEEQKKGTTIFFSSHNLNEVKMICDRVGVIRKGELIDTFKLDKIKYFNDSFIKIYSGEINKIKKALPLIKIKQASKTMLQFFYEGDINDLLKVLVGIKIDKLLITEPSLETIFFHYYKEDEDVSTGT